MEKLGADYQMLDTGCCGLAGSFGFENEHYDVSMQLEATAQKVEEKFGPTDIWVNDAMTTVFSEFKNVTPEEFRRGTEVT